MDRARWRTTLTYRLLPTLQLGVEYNPAVGEVNPMGTWFLLTEESRRPAVFLGTSSDRIGSPEGTQAVYLTAAKYLERVPVSPYVSLNYSEWDEGINFPFGAEWYVYGGYSARFMYDGNQPHAVVSWFGERFGVSLMAVWLDTFGISVAGGF